MSNPIQKPLTIDEVRQRVGNGTRLTVVLPLKFGELVDIDLESLNELVEERILPQDEPCISDFMEDIKYRVVGSLEEPLQENYFTAGIIFLEVSGYIEFYE